MSMQSAQDFFQAVSSNPALLAEVTEATTSLDLDRCATAFAALGKREGFDFTPAEATQAREAAMETLSDGDLEEVVGGAGAGLSSDLVMAPDIPSGGWFVIGSSPIHINAPVGVHGSPVKPKPAPKLFGNI